MPNILSTVRFTDIQGWIPETDIDGIDANTKYLSEQINADLQNGFIQPALVPISEVLPTNIAAVVASGYSLLSAKTFVHSVRGVCTFYVLYKYTGGIYYYSFYLVDSTYTTGAEISTEAGFLYGVSFTGVPSNINYNFVNDQLRINLNTTVTVSTVAGGVRATVSNLTLIYGTAKTIYNSISYPAGWYLMPRWLGFSYAGVADIKIVSDSGFSRSSLTEPCDDATYITNMTAQYETIVDYSGVKFLVADLVTSPSPSEPGFHYADVTISGIQNFKKFSFEGMVVSNTGTANPVIATISVTDSTGLVVYSREYAREDFIVFVRKLTAIDLNLIGGYNLIMRVWEDLAIKNLKIETYTADEVCIVGKNFDGQRALLGSSASNLLDVYGSHQIEVRTASIDVRIDTYEIYIYIDGLYKLVWEGLATATWTAGGLGKYLAISWKAMADIITTLNFNYALGHTVRVDNDRIIYSETSYRNRTYTVNGSFRVYQTQIAGNARHQPDSFPYDEANFYGFFELPRSESAQAVMVTPLEELVVLTSTRPYIYYMQISQGASYKRTKVVNGTAGIISAKSLVRDVSGNPNGNILAWADNNGIYAYGGGVDAPIDLTVKANIKNWWLQQGVTSPEFYKTNIIGFYYSQKNEIWFADGKSGGSKTILIYEIDYGRFKKYTFSFEIVEFIGVKSNRLYMLSSANTIYYYTNEAVYSTTERLSFTIKTHYITGFRQSQYSNIPHPIGEEEYKILQEVFIMNNDIDATNTNVEICVFVDGNQLPAAATYNLKVNKLYDHILYSLGVQYHKIKLSLTKSYTAIPRISIREFGFTFSIMDKGLNQ